MEVLLVSLIIAGFIILLLLFMLLRPRIQKLRRRVIDDSLEIQTRPHPFEFKESPDEKLNEQIVRTVNLMGGFGDDAEENYQASLEMLRVVAEKAVPIVVDEYGNLPEKQYLDRWSLIQLLVEMKHPSSLPALDKILSTPIPPERSKAPHRFSTRGEETIIRTTAVEAIIQVAAEGSREAADILLRYIRHENFSVKRAAIQGYLSLGRENARKVLREMLPESDHYILNIGTKDVRDTPQPRGDRDLKRPETDDAPTTRLSKVRKESEREHSARRR